MEVSPDYVTQPQRVFIIANPGTPNQELHPVFLNPSELREHIQVEWSRLPVIGLDHEIPHYSRTRSIEIPLSLYFSAYEAARRVENTTQTPAERATDLRAIAGSSMSFVNFFRSLCFPTRGGLRPATIRIRWPNIFDIQGVISDLEFQYHKFDRTLAPTVYQTNLTILETRISRRYAEEVRQFGLQHTEHAEEG